MEHRSERPVRRAGHLESTLSGRVALVTGASRGLGRAIAVALGRAGADVLCLARNAAELANTVAEVEAVGAKASLLTVDVMQAGDADRAVQYAMDHFGRVDILVNNAGVLTTKPFLETTTDDWQRILATNVMGPVNFTRAVGRHFVAQSSGKVINVSSVWGQKAVPDHTIYTSSKAALTQFTKTLAREWARHGIEVNAIAPGYFETDITAAGMADEDVRKEILRGIPQRRLGLPDEIGPLTVYLASDAASYVTGSVFTIDGGMALK